MNDKCILVYGLEEKEIEKIKNRRIRYKVVTEEKGRMQIKDILALKTVEENHYAKLPKEEKAIIFNGYSDKDLRNEIKFLRSFISGGVLAVVTELSKEWTFKYLIEHLIEERDFYKSQNQEE